MRLVPSISIVKDLFFCDSVVPVWNVVAGCGLEVGIGDNSVIISLSLVSAAQLLSGRSHPVQVFPLLSELQVHLRTGYIKKTLRPLETEVAKTRRARLGLAQLWNDGIACYLHLPRKL